MRCLHENTKCQPYRDSLLNWACVDAKHLNGQGQLCKRKLGVFIMSLLGRRGWSSLLLEDGIVEIGSKMIQSPTPAPKNALSTNNSVSCSLWVWPLVLAKQLKWLLARCLGKLTRQKQLAVDREQTVVSFLVQRDSLRDHFYTNVSHGKTWLKGMGVD